MHASLRRTSILLLGLALALAVVFVLAGCGATPPAPSSTGGGTTPVGGTGAPAAGGTTVTEQNFAFSPSNVTVNVGDVISFVNQDSAPHEVAIDGASLGQQAQGQTVKWTAAKAGTFSLKCLIHPSMTGQITVK